MSGPANPSRKCENETSRRAPQCPAPVSAAKHPTAHTAAKTAHNKPCLITHSQIPICPTPLIAPSYPTRRTKTTPYATCAVPTPRINVIASAAKQSKPSQCPVPAMPTPVIASPGAPGKQSQPLQLTLCVSCQTRPPLMHQLAHFMRKFRLLKRPSEPAADRNVC